MQRTDYERLLKELTELIDEGVQIVDERGVTIVYSTTMAKLEKTRREDVLGKPFREGFSGIPEDESTLLRALEKNIPTINKQQTFFNKYGKEVNTINTTIPVVKGGKTIAALEISKDITQLKEMSNKIMDFQNGSIAAHNTKPSKIKNYRFDDLIGESKNFRKLIDEAKSIADSPVPVLIFGETGTGKELFAQSIHFASSRRDKPFLAQNCAAFPESLLEGILFGTSKGGFTGAVDRAGLFEQASGGTLLLDEISAMPVSLQSKLLRVLQENYIRRVGDTKDIPVDVRILTTANEPLENLIKEGLFRKDLYYRLNIISLNLIPLRERKEDIPLLADEFIKKHNERLNKNITSISDKAKEKLMSYEYFGNVRELENIIIAAMSLTDDDSVLTADSIQFMQQIGEEENKDYFDLEGTTLKEKTGRIEEELINKALKEHNGNISRAAEHLGIKRQVLQYKLKKMRG